MVLQPLPLASGQIGDLEDDDAGVGEFGLELAPARLLRGDRCGDALADAFELLGRACSPSSEISVTPASTWPTRPATRTMKNSSRLLAEIERNRSRSSSGWLGLLGLLEHPAVELEPRQFAVDEPVGRRQQRRRRLVIAAIVAANDKGSSFIATARAKPSSSSVRDILIQSSRPASVGAAALLINGRATGEGVRGLRPRRNAMIAVEEAELLSQLHRLIMSI